MIGNSIKLLFVAFGFVLFVGCQQDQVAEESSQFNENYRPQYHFTPPAQWMNDPNGMVYHDGEYHLFYQHYPDSNVWGPMHWGHAVSTDLVRWEHLPIALYPDSLGWIFSGSAVMDLNNSSGLGTKENPPMVAIYTYHQDELARQGNIDFQYQGIAYSLDKGRSWTTYEGNPVLPNPGIIDFRDPKVSWMEEFQKWVMILAVKDHMEIYTSDDLLSWEKESEFGTTLGAHGGVWECPDLFTLTDETGATKWVMLISINPGGPQGGSATQYFVGDFDGSVFSPVDTTTRWIDYGADNYAGVTWSNVPESDGRRLFIGWMSNWQYANLVPTYAWRSAMTIPRELLLTQVAGAYLIQSKPVEELMSLQGSLQPIETSFNLTTNAFYMELLPKDSNPFALTLSNGIGEKLVISVNQERLKIDRSASGRADFSEDFAAVHQAPLDGIEVQSLKVYFDRMSVEVFINDGVINMTDLVFPTEDYRTVSIEGEVKATYAPMKSIWGN